MALTVGVTLYTWRWRKVPGATPFVMAMLCIFLFVVSAVLEILSDSSRAKLVFYNVRQVGAVFLPVAWVLLVWEQQNQRRWRSVGGLVAICSMPIVTILLIGTSGWHTIIRQSVYMVMYEGVGIIRVVSGIWMGINLVFMAALSLGALTLLGGDILRSRSAFRSQSFFLFLALLLPVIVTVLGILNINPITPLQPITVTFLPTVICASWALFRYGLFDFVPVAANVVIEQISDAVVVVDRKFRIAQSNPAADQLFKASQQKFGDLIAVEIHGIPMLAQLPLMDKRVTASTVRQEVSEDGRTYDANVSPFMPRGQWMGDIVILRDVTEQRMAQDQKMELILERERALLLKNFVMDASHELRTPITNIRSTSYLVARYLSKLRELVPMQEEIIAMFDKIEERNQAAEENVKRLNALVEDMLNMVRLEDPDWLQKETTNFTHWLAQTLDAQKALLKEVSITLQTYLPPTPTPVSLNSDQLTLALDHLFLNAQGRQSHTVIASMKASKDNVTLMLSDDGETIPRDQIENMFTRFYKGDLVSTTKVYSGLGLAMARRIILAHGGNLTVQSDGSNVFTIELPVSFA
jgi:signal transduction histidine kinase